jgi:hypothetical protein
MASVVESIMQPDEPTIKAHLEVLFAPLREEYPQGLIEICYGPNKPNQAQFFNLHKDGIADATAFAASRARAGENIYVGVNPRKPQTKLAHRANDSDVEIAIWQFADIDKAESLDGLGKKLRPLPPYYTVDTGTIPHRRPHLYWLLDEPVRNLEQWTQRQSGLAAQLGGDAVINPSRIMRLAGTVNFPPPHKVQRGYRVELATIKTEFDDEREAVQPELIAAAFAAPFFDHSQNVVNTALAPIPAGQNTLQAMRSTQLHELLEACRAGTEWHNNMIRLVGHLAAKGRANAEILAMADHITLPGYTVAHTQREMMAALQSARVKWDLPEPEDKPVEQEEAAREPADAIFDLLDIDQLDALPPPSWLVHELIVDDGLSVLYGDPGAGKSFFAIDLGLRLAHGMEWHGREAHQTGVLYIAGEGARGLGKRIKGWRYKHAMDGVEAPFLLLPVAVELLDEKQRGKLLRTIDAACKRAGFEIGLIVVDTVSRALAGADENGQEAMGAFVKACDAIRHHAGGAVLGVHHSGKDKDRGMRGSTVLLGACDAVFKLSKAETLVTLKTEKQKDAEQAADLYFDMEQVAWASGLQEEQRTLVPALKTKASAEIGQRDDAISMDMIRRAFGRMADAWGAGRPLSPHPRARTEGRYAPFIFMREIGGKAEDWAALITAWLETECLAWAQTDSKSKRMGLQVLAMPGA